VVGNPPYSSTQLYEEHTEVSSCKDSKGSGGADNVCGAAESSTSTSTSTSVSLATRFIIRSLEISDTVVMLIPPQYAKQNFTDQVLVHFTSKQTVSTRSSDVVMELRVRNQGAENKCFGFCGKQVQRPAIYQVWTRRPRSWDPQPTEGREIPKGEGA
jgi:hypothetical protein